MYVCTVTSEDHGERAVRLTLQVSKAIAGSDTVVHELEAELFTTSGTMLLGRTILVKGRLRPSRSPQRPNLLDGAIVASDLPRPPWAAVFSRVASSIDGSFRSLFGPDAYDLATGLVFGGSGRVGGALRDAFTRAGVLHILSVSGLHVGFVVSFAGLLLLFVPLSPRIKFIIVLAVLFVYAGITGFRPSVMRASLMAGLFGLAMVSQRRVDPVHVLNVSALLLLVLDPSLLFDVGAQLSFASVYGILCLYPVIQPRLVNRVRPKFIRHAVSLMTISFCAQLFVTPLLVQYFGRTQPVAVISNLFIVPLTTAVTYSLFACALAGQFLLPLARFFAFISSGLLAALCALARFFSSLPFSSVAFTVPAIFSLVFYLIFARRSRKLAVYLLLSLSVLFSAAALSPCLLARVSRYSCRLDLPSNQTVVCSRTGRVTADPLRYEGARCDCYIGPPRSGIDAREHVDLPGPLRRATVSAGRVRIDVGDGVRVRYGEDLTVFDTGDGTQGNMEYDEVIYRLTNGRRMYEFRTRGRASLLDRIAADARVLAIRLRLLF